MESEKWIVVYGTFWRGDGRMWFCLDLLHCASDDIKAGLIKELLYKSSGPFRFALIREPLIMDLYSVRSKYANKF